MRHSRLILAFLLFLMALMLKPANANEKQEHFKWNKRPTIVMCYRDFPMHLLFRAVEFWGTRGHKFDDVILTSPVGICAPDYVPDTIIIRRAPKGKLKGGQIGVTQRVSDGDGNMIASVIWFDHYKLNEPYIIEHELGHGLGYAHVNHKNHVMNPWSNNMGPEFWIP
jgi:hypothetical protein